MASKLCCTAEDESRSSSPDLPNARVTDTATPAKLPLLQQETSSQHSHFTSARTEELHELRQIFHNASDDDPNPTSLAKAGRARFIRPSVYSLHSLHKMKSMHSMIRRKFSRDLSKKPLGNVKSGSAKSVAAAADQDKNLPQVKDDSSLQLKITKDELRKDLLSVKKPEEGGYDPDAQELDDIARNVGKRTPKRPSIHSIDWSPSTGSKPTPGSSSKSRQSHPVSDVEPYQIKSHILSGHSSQVLSTPNLRADSAAGQEHRLWRSHSTAVMQLPAPLSLSPLRLPSLKNGDQEGVPWSIALTESLRLSQFPIPPRVISIPPREISPSRSKVFPQTDKALEAQQSRSQNQGIESLTQPSQARTKEPPTPATVVEIRVQEPTSFTPRPSSSAQDTVPENLPPTSEEGQNQSQGTDEEEDTRRSVHLYSMRISHHLRSGSLLSWDNLATVPDLRSPPHTHRDRSVSGLSRISFMQPRQLSRHEKKTSSSGFASARVPSKWGCVVPTNVRDDESSIYSSRPQSPPDSSGGSVMDLPQSISKYDGIKQGPKHSSVETSSVDLTKLRRSNSYPTDNDDTPRPPTRHGLTNLQDVASYSVFNRSPPKQITRLSRNNSVECTKKSKFREEFSPSPPKKRLITSASIMRLINPKRNSIRSQSESVSKPAMEPVGDGTFERPHPATYRERRFSSSLEAKPNTMPMWEQALKNHQDERAAMFLPKNKQLAVHSSPIRERRHSALRLRLSMDSGTSPGKPKSMKRFSAPLLGSSPFTDLLPDEPQALPSRRTAIIGQDSGEVSFSDEIQRRFDRQTDAAETVGAWGRYPSHSRPDRTTSAGHPDSVEIRDFALEAAIKFATGESNNTDEDDVDPIERPSPPPLLPGQKRRKKRIGHQRMAKSNSMTFGKNLLKNYTKIFRSQSIEFQKHGYGHRSSITGGGTLDYPELEILPDVFRPRVIVERSREHGGSQEQHEQHEAREEYSPGDKKGKGKLNEDGHRSTLRTLNSSNPSRCNLTPQTLDGAAENLFGKDNTRALSAYYEDCLLTYPRASTELEFGSEDFGAPTRHSFESKRASIIPRTFPARLTKHSRNASRVSRLSVVSNTGARPSSMPMGEDDDGGVDERSIASVRRSTMDLVTQYKEQEKTERERVLSLMRAESQRRN